MIRRRSIASALAVAALAATFLAGCAADAPPTDATGAPDAEPATLSIGMMFDLSGRFSALGAIDQNALDLVLDDLTARAADDGITLEVQAQDSQSDPDKAVQLARQYTRDGVQAIIGPSPQGSCLATREYLAAEGVLQYCLSGGPFDWTPLFFSGELPPTGALGEAPVTFFESQGWGHVGCLAPSGPSGDAYAVPLEAAAEAAGMEYTLIQYPADASDLTPQLLQMRDGGVDVVYSCASGPAVVGVARAVTQLGWDVPIFAGQGSVNMDVLDATKGFIPSAGVYSNGNYTMLPEAMPPSDPRYDVVNSFASAYRDAYGISADVTSATLVDALTLLIDSAIELHASGEDVTGTALSEVLEGTTGYQGIVSEYSFSPTDHRGSQSPTLIFEWTPDGEFSIFEE